MSFIKKIMRWDSRVQASIAMDQELIELEAKRIKLLFESLKKQGFNEDQAVQIVAGMYAKRSS